MSASENQDRLVRAFDLAEGLVHRVSAIAQDWRQIAADATELRDLACQLAGDSTEQNHTTDSKETTS